MGKDGAGLNVFGHVMHVFVMPSGLDGTIQCGLCNTSRVPTHTKAISVGRLGTFRGSQALHDDRMTGVVEDIPQTLGVSHVS
jgi:hypothetical protein